MIKLEDVNSKNWRTTLKVSEEQKDFVADKTVLLARAYAYREYRSRAFFILNDKTYVGMGLFYDSPERNAYIFSQLFIDEKFQGQGFGKTAAKLVLDEMKKDGKYKKVALCYVEGATVAKKLYEDLGFSETGRDEDEIEMELTFR
jgi:diamine N-acetyltransferase